MRGNGFGKGGKEDWMGPVERAIEKKIASRVFGEEMVKTDGLYTSRRYVSPYPDISSYFVECKPIKGRAPCKISGIRTAEKVDEFLGYVFASGWH